jgi:small conductance mechanosensitive channel
VPIAATADVAAASAAMLAVAQELRSDEVWADAFMGEPEVLGVEQFTRFETVIRLVVKVRPMEQWRVARELRVRIQARLEHLDIESQLAPEPDLTPAEEPPTA